MVSCSVCISVPEAMVRKTFHYIASESDARAKFAHVEKRQPMKVANATPTWPRPNKQAVSSVVVVVDDECLCEADTASRASIVGGAAARRDIHVEVKVIRLICQH